MDKMSNGKTHAAGSRTLVTLRANKDESTWVAPSARRLGRANRMAECGAPEEFMNAPKANPCSLNLVPPAKKHNPRTYGYR